ncbi:S1 family peptidase [Hamadaea sp. NPDC051192]|uniref:S1 family peptidase n=1 Tax=Hamadaea sp. NPDC051192 TaxID=3154940 RepID=UPI00343E504C
MTAGLLGLFTGGVPAHAIVGGGVLPAADAGYLVRLNAAGVQACTGVLVAPQWVVTLASCFAANGKVASGPPPRPTTAEVAGSQLSIVTVVPHTSRDLALAMLSLRVLDVAPVPITGTPLAAGDAVRAAGYGRTGTVWVPDKAYVADGTVDAVTADSFTWATSTAAACQGDAGGPVLRTGGQPELAGLLLDSGQDGCLSATTTGHGATAVRLDDVAPWVATTTRVDPAAGFTAPYHSSAGIGSFDLADARDQVVPFDFDHSGKLDHLLMYRPGTGFVQIVRQNSDHTFTTILSSTSGIGGYDLMNAKDRVLAYDYDHSGKLDHLVLYRPGDRIVHVLRRDVGTRYLPVYADATVGIGTWNLGDSRDQIVAYDYDHSGKADHLLIYRPGTGLVSIIKHGTGNTFSKVFASTTGIGGYDLKGNADRILAFDYDHSGKVDHLVLYRPVARTVWILKHGAANTYTAVYNATTGIGGYNVGAAEDQLLAYDYDYSGKRDHLVAYRPGTGIVWILQHGTGNTFTAVVTSSTGIGGYNMLSTADRIVAFDYDHSGGANYLLAYRPAGKTIWAVGRAGLRFTTVVAPRPIEVRDTLVEKFAYPGAAEILAQLNVRLIAGDGHILLADCTTPPVNNVGVIQVWTTEQVGPDASGHICFKVTAATGRLDLQVPGVFEIRGDGQQTGYGHGLVAVVDTASAAPITVVVNPSGSTQVGQGADPSNEPTTLLQLRVPA